VARLLDLLGYDTADAGSLVDSRRFERDTPAYGVPYMVDPADYENTPGKRATPPCSWTWWRKRPGRA